jgi:hydroxymethylpyrimidine pyrophosphatase-like HAD family hydrolase/fructoselysine-6-P-deglycase FrlB-like protein
MTSRRFDVELDKFPATYASALKVNIDAIKSAIAGASESSIIGVGSGGSFTVASLLCSLHEKYTGRVSRPSTPLEIICNPTLAASCPVFLVSAEGKNPDIVAALQRARMYSARPVHVITNRNSSPLMEQAGRLTNVSTHVFGLDDKDGYLATNSLLLDATLIARAYEELDKGTEHIPSILGDLRLADLTISDWLNNAAPFIKETANRGSVIVTFSPLLRAVATDLESKLAESALLHCQLADMRSFAHGRHLWLAERSGECTVIALIEPLLFPLWSAMQALLPSNVPTLAMPFQGARPRDLLAGLVAEMHLVSAIALHLRRDPGAPFVPQFGRELHYIDIPSLIAAPQELSDGEQSKYDVLGAHWPSVLRRGPMRRALDTFEAAIGNQVFRAIVFDYDGVLCASRRDDIQLSEQIVEYLRRLIDGGVIVGIASGRGGSVRDNLRACIPESAWPRIQLGLYNGGYVSDLAAATPAVVRTDEFLNHVRRIVGRLKHLGVPIETIRKTEPYQVSVRFRDGVQVGDNWFVIADALRQAGLDVARVVRSKHSVDILGAGVNKSRLVAHIIQTFKIDPYQILTMGDLGAWPGNDYSLLEHRFSLSVDVPSRRLDRGWKLAPPHKRDVDATLWYFERLEILGNGEFRIRVREVE